MSNDQIRAVRSRLEVSMRSPLPEKLALVIASEWPDRTRALSTRTSS